MEKMQYPSCNADQASDLYEAAMTGDTSTLHRLIQRDALILKRSTLSSFSETPLHISALAGHVDFTREILRQDPEMAAEVDSSNSTPLHLAAAPGHTEIVRILLGVVGAAEACLVRDEDGRIPLHLAAIRGRVGVVRELVLARPESVLEKLDGDTVLHLCVKYNHLDALKLLVEMIDLSSIMWLLDQDGNTLLHLAVIFRQVQTTSYLLASLANMGESGAINCLNGHGWTPLDCLEPFPKDYKSQRIRNLLVEAGGDAIQCERSQDHRTPSPNYLVQLPASKLEVAQPQRKSKTRRKYSCKSIYRDFKNFMAYDSNWPVEMKETMLLVATIIASMSFQAASNPPGGVWSENKTSSLDGARCNNSTNVCEAGTSVQANGGGGRPFLLHLFVAFNTVAFGASLGIILLIVGGFPIKKNKLVTWILIRAVSVALTFMTLSFVVAGLLVIPNHSVLVDTELVHPDHSVLIDFAFWGLLLLVWILLIVCICLLDPRFGIWLFDKLHESGFTAGCELWGGVVAVGDQRSWFRSGQILLNT